MAKPQHSRRAMVAGIASTPVVLLPSIPAAAFSAADLAEAARTVEFHESRGERFAWLPEPCTYLWADMSGRQHSCTVTDPEAMAQTEALRAVLWQREHRTN